MPHSKSFVFSLLIVRGQDGLQTVFLHKVKLHSINDKSKSTLCCTNIPGTIKHNVPIQCLGKVPLYGWFIVFTCHNKNANRIPRDGFQMYIYVQLYIIILLRVQIRVILHCDYVPKAGTIR